MIKVPEKLVSKIYINISECFLSFYYYKYIVPLNQTNYTDRENGSSNSDNTDVNLLIIDDDSKPLLPRRQSQQFHTFSKINKYFFLLSLLIIITLGILIIFLIIETKKTNHFKNTLDIKENMIFNLEKQKNQSLEQLNNIILEQNKTIQDLNKQLIDLEKEKSNIYYHIKYYFLLLFV